MPEVLHWLKEVGIATATLLVLGNILLKVLQSFLEYYQGVREDNKARNKHFDLLLQINQTIASQMELTRKAIERSSRVNDRHEDAIRASTTEITSMHHQLQQGFTDTQQALEQHLQPVSSELAQLTSGISGLTAELDAEYAALEKSLTTTAESLVNSIDARLDDTEGAIARTIANQILPIVTKLDELAGQIIQTRQDIIRTVEHAAYVKKENMVEAQAMSDRSEVNVSQP